MKAFAYIRVSGKSQVEGDGPDRQREKIIAFCDKRGLEVESEHFEEGVSGTIDAMERPAFIGLLECAESEPLGEPCCVVVERMDRLARTLVVQELLLAECAKRGIKVFAADQGELKDQASDGADPSVVLIRQILGAVAQWEKSVIVMKLKSARDRKKKATGRCEGPKPYGATEAERDIQRFIATGVEENRSLSQIADELNLGGLKTRTGKQWNKARVSHIFQNLV